MLTTTSYPLLTEGGGVSSPCSPCLKKLDTKITEGLSDLCVSYLFWPQRTRRNTRGRSHWHKVMPQESKWLNISNCPWVF
jgi:hypothetical protein